MKRFADPLLLTLLLAVAFAIAYPRWRAGIDWRDEGLLAYGAERVAEGQVPHRDFVTLQPPFSYYTAAAMFKTAGTSLMSLRLLGVAIFLVLPLLVYGVARSLTVRPILSFAAAVPACVLGLPYVYFVPVAAWQGIIASFAAVLLYIRASLSNRRWLGVPAGFLTAASMFLRHDQAVYTALSIFVLTIALGFLVNRAISRTDLRRVFVFWLIGISLITVPALIVWWRIGALPEMFKQLVVFPFATYRKTSSLPFPKFSAAKTIPDAAVVTLYYLPLVVQAVCAGFLMRAYLVGRFGRREAALLFLTVWSGLFYLQAAVRSDQNHLMMTLPPFFVLSAFGFSIVRQTIGDHRLRIGLSIVAAILAVAFLWTVRPIALPNVSAATEYLAVERGGIRVEQGGGIGNFVKALQMSVPPSKSILALPYQPMFYFLCDRRNPTRWNYLWPGDQTAADHQRFIEESEQDPPAVALLSEERELASYAPAIVDYISGHYVRTAQVGRMGIYVRRE